MKIKIIDLIILTYRKEMPYKIMYEGEEYVYNKEFEEYVCCDHDLTPLLNIYNQYGLTILDDKVEILEEEKKIPEKHINNYGDLIILGQQDNWTQKFNIKTKEMETTGIELNPYVFEAINENFKDIENKINEIIDYLKSKGDE